MKDYIFFFDLDATVTSAQLFPEIAKTINKADEMIELTGKAMQGDIPFYHSFMERINILKNVPVSEARRVVSNLPLNSHIVEFIREHRERCYIVTSNLNVWISDLLKKLDMEERCFCTEATVKDDYILDIKHIIDKGEVVRRFEDYRVVAIGEGNNDAQMMLVADVGIGFGGVRDVSPAVLKCATHIVYSEERLCQFLRQLL